MTADVRMVAGRRFGPTVTPLRRLAVDECRPVQNQLGGGLGLLIASRGPEGSGGKETVDGD
jgi:hypothetical protein